MILSNNYHNTASGHYYYIHHKNTLTVQEYAFYYKLPKFTRSMLDQVKALSLSHSRYLSTYVMNYIMLLPIPKS